MKILFAADMSFSMYKEFPGSEAVKKIMGNTAEEFRKADFSVINLENIFGNKDGLTPIPKSGPNLISTDDFAEFVDILHPDVVGLANNHCSDYGETALMDTMKLLHEKGYKTAGAGKNLDEAYESAVLEKDGIKAAIIAVCENEPGIAGEESPGSAGYNLWRVKEAIKKANAKGELPIIYFHGGNEYNPFPSPEKTELYRLFIELGAKAVIAMHTHCPQGYEMYMGCPIVYSMGNFFFPSKNEPELSWYYGYLTVLDFNEDNIGIEIIPYYFDMEEHRILCDEEKEKFMQYISYLSEAISDKKRIRQYFDAWSIIKGVGMLLPYINYTEELLPGAPESIMRMKNVMCCEAHNEVVRNAFKILYDGRLEEAKKYIPEIKRLQNMEL